MNDTGVHHSEARWSLRAAIALARAVARRDPGSGEQVEPGLGRRITCLAAAPLMAYSPGVVIISNDGAMGRLCNIRTGRLFLAALFGAALLCVIAGITGVIALDTVIAIVGVVALLGVVPVSTELSVHRTGQTADWLMTDMIRTTNGSPGAGQRLVAAVAERDVIGTAHNQRLWDKVYAPHATLIGTSGQRRDFRLKKT